MLDPQHTNRQENGLKKWLWCKFILIDNKNKKMSRLVVFGLFPDIPEPPFNLTIEGFGQHVSHTNMED